MRIVFAGTPAFAAASLDALVRAGHHVTLVLTQPDRPAGRGLRPQPAPVKQLAMSLGLPVAQPVHLKDPESRALIAAESPDVMVVAAYGLILPADMLALPRLGCVNVHASLLPRWRGAAPIHRAILAGDEETGISIMQMDEGLDTGAVLMQKSIPIASDDTTGTLHDKLATLGGALLVAALAQPARPAAQNPGLATYAAKVSSRDAGIDWNRPAIDISRQIRAFNPAPGAHTVLDGTVLKLWQACLEPAAAGLPGMVCDAGPDGITVAAASGGLRITELQRAGGKRLSARAFLAGFPLPPGTRLGSA